MNHLPMDLHTHSLHSFDGQYSVETMCAAAAAMNIGIFAITDHCEMQTFKQSDLPGTFQAAASELTKAGRAYAGKMQVLSGIELGQPLVDLELSQAMLQSQPFDFVLGSVHLVRDRQDFYFLDYDSPDLNLNLELELYFKELLATIRWGGFDSAAHISYPFRYIPKNYKGTFKLAQWDDYFDGVVKLLAEKGIALELNTSGLDQNPPYTLPEIGWVRRYREHGGEALTLGSDAHVPEKVGCGIAQAVGLAQKCGFNYLCYYKARLPHYLSIKD